MDRNDDRIVERAKCYRAAHRDIKNAVDDEDLKKKQAARWQARKDLFDAVDYANRKTPGSES